MLFNLYRFFVFKKQDSFFVLEKDNLLHIKVLRLKEDSQFYCIYQGKYYLCSLKGKMAKILNEEKIDHEYSQKVAVGIGTIKLDHLKIAIQKATELGATNIYLFKSEFTSNLKYLNRESLTKVIISAAEQSARNIIPNLLINLSFNDVLELPYKNRFIAYEQAIAQKRINFPIDALYLVGPEGGFSKNEIQLAQNKGFNIISLGKRILRSETALISILSNVNYCNG